MAHPRTDKAPWTIARRAWALGGAGVVACVMAALAATSVAPTGVHGDARWLAVALVLMVVSLGLAGPRFCALLPPEGPRPPALEMATLQLASTVLNLSFPGPAGELAAAAAVNRRHGLPVTAALASSVHGRLTGLAAAGVLTLAAIPLQPNAGDRRLAMAAAGAVGLVGLAVGLLSAWPELFLWVGGFPRWLLRGAPPPVARAGDRLSLAVERLGEALVTGARLGPVPWLRALGWSLGAHALLAVAVVVCGRAVGVDVPLPVAVLAHAASVVASVALVVLPGGLGAFDAVFLGVLTLAGGLATWQAGLVLAAVRGVQLAGMAVAGVAFMAWAHTLLLPASPR